MFRMAFFWTVVGQIAGFVINFAGSVIIARLLSPREMGIYAVAIATVGILQIIAAFGVGNYVIRATKLDDHTLDTAFTVNAVLGLCLGAAIFVLASAGAAFLADPAVASVMRLLALAPIISIFEFRPSAMLQREMQFKRVSLIGTVQALASAVVTITAASLGQSYMSPGYGGLAAALVGAIGYNLAGRHHVSLRLSRRDWRPMATFGLRMMSIGGVSAVAARLSDIILGHFLGVAALGLFARANNLSMLIFTNIYGTATRVIFAKLSRDYREHGQLHDTFLRGLRALTGVMGPILIGLAVLSPPAIRLLYGDKWLGAALPLSLLMVAQFITLRYAMNWELFVIKDELKVQTRIEIVRSLSSLVTRTVGSLFSIVAVAAGMIVDGVFAIALYGRQINRLIDASEREMMGVSAEAVFLTLVAVLPASVLMLWSGWDARTPLPLVSGSVALGAVLWFGALAWRRHPLMDELTLALAYLRARIRPPTGEEAR